jgi:hypothetical protein
MNDMPAQDDDEKGSATGQVRNKKDLLRELARIRGMSPPVVKPPFGWHLIREDRDRR